MARDDSISRRTVMKLAGATTATAVLAGCMGGDDDDDDDNGNGAENGDDQFEIEPDTTIVFDGQTAGWVGKEPAAIEGVENPTLVLQEGEEYEIGWDEGDGSDHNIEIRDEDGNVVNDLETEWVSEPDEDQFLEFEASEEMAVYRCEPHAQMEGDLVIDPAEDDENGEENGDDNGDDDGDDE